MNKENMERIQKTRLSEFQLLMHKDLGEKFEKEYQRIAKGGTGSRGANHEESFIEKRKHV